MLTDLLIGKILGLGVPKIQGTSTSNNHIPHIYQFGVGFLLIESSARIFSRMMWELVKPLTGNAIEK